MQKWNTVSNTITMTVSITITMTVSIVILYNSITLPSIIVYIVILI